MNEHKDFITIRILFSKTGRARYISHLDLNRTMIRAIRRAQLPIWYTEGFNRHPYVTFAAPLSLGYEGERETMDLRLQENMELEELVRRLDEAMPEGLHVYAAAPAEMKAGEAVLARYRVSIGCSPDLIRELLARATVLAEKRTKKKTMKTVDLKPVLDASGAVVRESADGGTELELTLPCGGELSVNPSLLVEILRRETGDAALPFSVRRLDVTTAEGRSFR